jgi:anti-sigma regulatory factor (Ser/Thr protein kinase)
LINLVGAGFPRAVLGQAPLVETLRVTIACDARELAHLREELTRWLEEAGVPIGLRLRAVLATHEAAANSIRHADPCCDLRLCAAIDRQTLIVEVVDTGDWDGQVAGDGDDEHGRGLALLSDLMARVEIQTSPHGTTVRMSQPIVL